jgi:hypothetical protein
MLINYTRPSPETGWHVQPEPIALGAKSIHKLYAELIKVAYGELNTYPVVYNPDNLQQLIQVSREYWRKRPLGDITPNVLSNIIAFRYFGEQVKKSDFEDINFDNIFFTQYQGNPPWMMHKIDSQFAFKLPYTPALLRMDCFYRHPWEFFDDYQALFKYAVVQQKQKHIPWDNRVLPFIGRSFLELYDTSDMPPHMPLLYALALFGWLRSLIPKNESEKWEDAVKKVLPAMLRTNDDIVLAYHEALNSTVMSLINPQYLGSIENWRTLIISHYVMLYYYPRLFVWLTVQPEFYWTSRKVDFYLKEDALKILIKRIKANKRKSNDTSDKLLSAK